MHRDSNAAHGRDAAIADSPYRGYTVIVREREMMSRMTTVQMSQRGTITLPPEIRRGVPDDTIFVVIRRDDGVIELRPRLLIDPAQAWFWSEEWQQREREADADIAHGRIRRFENIDELFADLDDPE